MTLLQRLFLCANLKGVPMLNTKKFFTVQMLVEASLMIALAHVINLFPIFPMPQGGDISLSMLPLIIYSIRWGFLPGLVVGAMYGLVSLLIGPFIIHPIQLLLDYPLPSAMMGLCALSYKEDKDLFIGYIPAIIISYLLKFLMHFLSGLIFFPEYAGVQNPAIYSFIYNMSFIGPEIVISLIIIGLLWKPLKLIIRKQD